MFPGFALIALVNKLLNACTYEPDDTPLEECRDQLVVFWETFFIVISVFKELL